MAQPTKKWSKGKMTISLWKGNYEGKETTSFSVQKNYKKKDGTWEHSQFFTEPDLRDLGILALYLCAQSIKEKTFQPKSEPEPEQMPVGEENSDF